MAVDKELLEDFVAEIRSLETELKVIVDSLKLNVDQPKQFEAFGLFVDRIYGTASTLGFPELANYCGMLKKTCVDCVASNNKRAQNRVFGLMENFMQNLAALLAGVYDVEATKKIHHLLHLESQKAKKLQDEIFKFTKKVA